MSSHTDWGWGKRWGVGMTFTFEIKASWGVEEGSVGVVCDTWGWGAGLLCTMCDISAIGGEIQSFQCALAGFGIVTQMKSKMSRWPSQGSSNKRDGESPTWAWAAAQPCVRLFVIENATWSWQGEGQDLMWDIFHLWVKTPVPSILFFKCYWVGKCGGRLEIQTLKAYLIAQSFRINVHYVLPCCMCYAC